MVCKRMKNKQRPPRPVKNRPVGLAGKEYSDFEIDEAFFEPLPDEIISVYNSEESLIPMHKTVDEVYYCKLHKPEGKSINMEEVNDAIRTKLKDKFT